MQKTFIKCQIYSFKTKLKLNILLIYLFNSLFINRTQLYIDICVYIQYHYPNLSFTFLSLISLISNHCRCSLPLLPHLPPSSLSLYPLPPPSFTPLSSSTVHHCSLHHGASLDVINKHYSTFSIIPIVGFWANQLGKEGVSVRRRWRCSVL